MRKGFGSIVLAVLATAGALSAPAASAATEVGNGCAGNKSSIESMTLLSLGNAPGNPLPAVIPDAGVITRWKLNFPPFPPGLASETLKVMRPTGVPKQFQVVGESLAGGLSEAPDDFLTRIPVLAGDRLGLTGNPIVSYCETKVAGDLLGVVLGSAATGSTVTTSEEGPGFQIPVVAFVEPDVDGDGYGDETQDKCPQSAAYQTPCPVITLDAISQVGIGSVTILVASSLNAPVKVVGTAKLGKGSTVTIKKTQTVSLGKISRFKLRFPGKLKAKLQEMAPGQKLTLKVTATATNIAGPASTAKLKVKLKGLG